MNFRIALLVYWAFVLCCSEVSCRNFEKSRSKRTVTDGFGNASCENVRSFFITMSNVSLQTDGSKGSICGGQCCDEDTEVQLRKRAQRSFAALLQHNSRSLQGVLSATGTALQNHVSEIASQSENKTLLLFSQVYRGMSVLSRDPIKSLYGDIRRYVQINSTSESSSPPAIDMKTSVNRFFIDLFPLVYHNTLNAIPRDFAPEYKACLKKYINEVQPYGDIPRQTSQSLSKSLEATVLLLKSFRTGIDVLNATDHIFTDDNFRHNSECHDALLRMTYCPKCLGLAANVKPCAEYCLNVLRGCLTRYVVDLDSPWNTYVEAIERLVTAVKNPDGEAGLNLNTMIRSLDTRISEAIMYAMEKGKEIDNRVKRYCGIAKFTQIEDPRLTEPSSYTTMGAGKPRQTSPRLFSSLPESQLMQLLGSLSKSKGFYGNLADTLCHDESSTEPKGKHCWNGQRIAEYTKTVADMSLDSQKYNPEVKANPNLQNGDPHIADLADKLRQVHQFVVTSLGSSSDSDIDYMQRDGVDGSGSGAGPYDEDEEYTRGSGSGDSEIEATRTAGGDGISVTGTENTHPYLDETKTTPKTEGKDASAGATVSTTLLVFLILPLARIFY